MVCKHANEALKKIGSLGDEVRNEDSPLYGYEGPYVKYETANQHMDTMVKWANEVTGKEDKRVEFFKKGIIDEIGGLSPFFVSKINRSVLRERVLEIIGILNNCNCIDEGEAIAKLAEKFVRVESYERLKNELREKEEKVRKLEEKLRAFEAGQGFEARQESS